MLIKRDYDYKELEQFISKENLHLYYVIRNHNQQDNFTLLTYEYIGESATIEELNYFMSNFEESIKQRLGLIK